LTIKSKYVIIKEKEKEKDMRKNLEVALVEIENAMKWNSEVMTTLGFEMDKSETKNDRLKYEHNQCEKSHKKLFEALVLVKKVLNTLGE
jgi:hypothetical protein